MSRRSELLTRHRAIAAFVLIGLCARPAWTTVQPKPHICDGACFQDTVTTVHLAGKWYAPPTESPSIQRLGRGRLTLRFVAIDGPSGLRPGPRTGHIACAPLPHTAASTCPGRAGDLRNITLAEHGATGLDSLIRDFVAAA